MLYLRVFKHLLQIVDQAAGHTALVEQVNPVGLVVGCQALIDLKVECFAVDRTPVFAFKTFVSHPLRCTQNVAKTLPDFGAKNRNIDVAITGFVNPCGNTGGMEVTGLPGFIPIDQPARCLKIHHVNHGFKQRRMQPLPFA